MLLSKPSSVQCLALLWAELDSWEDVLPQQGD